MKQTYEFQCLSCRAVVQMERETHGTGSMLPLLRCDSPECGGRGETMRVSPVDQ